MGALAFERENLLVNMADDQRQLDEMTEQWRAEGSACCPSCRFGQAYTKVCKRWRRRRDRLMQIDTKLYYLNGNYGPLPRSAA